MHDENFGVKNLPNFDPVFIFKAENFKISARVMPKLLRKKENVFKFHLKP
jgi:hypothetical protein